VASASLLLLGWLPLAAEQARAQCAFDASVPSEGDVLMESPAPMVISFVPAIHVTGLRLTGADGMEWPLAWTKTDENVFKIEFTPTKSLPPGRYQIEWSAYIRQHYHPDGGVITFTLAPEGSIGVSTAATPAEARPAGAAPRAAPGSPFRVPQAVAAPPADR
jgi:methionine-rich copper-binding protein CopC